MKKEESHIEIIRSLKYTLVGSEEIFPEIEATSEILTDGTAVVNLSSDKKGDMFDIPLELIPTLCESLQRLHKATTTLMQPGAS